MIVVLSLLFLMSVQPVIMVVSLIFITLVYSLYVYMMMGSYWYSYVLMLVMLSGVLVVFTYMVGLIPNESFEVYGVVVLVIVMGMVFKGVWMMYGEDMSFVSLSLWVGCVSVLNLFLVVFLLGIMVMSVWVSCVSKSALRVDI